MHLTHIKRACKRANQRYDPQTNSRVLTTYSGTDASGQVLQTNFEAHTASGLPTRISDPEGPKTLLSYNNAGDLSQTSSYTYNSAGQLSQSTDRKGQNTTYTYDPAGRISSVTESDGTVNSYTYDNANRPIQRKISFVGTGDPATTPTAPLQTTTYQWNKASQITRIGLSIGVTNTTTNPELVSTYTYDAAGRLSSKTLPAAANTPANAQNVVQGITQTYAFDAADRLSQIKYTKSDGTLIDQIDYTYDAAGQRISKTMLNGNSAQETPMTASFDAGNRMQSITLNPGKPEQKLYTLTYDNNGNLTKKQLSTDTNCTLDCTDYVWDARNRLTQIKQNSTTR